MQKKILITGGSGFLGSHLSDILSENGYKVIIYDINNSKYIKKNQKFIKGDLSNKEKLIKDLKDVHAVYHFASIADIYKANQNPHNALNANIICTNNLLEACIKNKIKQFIFASSIYVYSKYGGIYRITKQTCESLIEHYAERYSLNFTILRFGSLYGTRANNFNWMSKILREAITKKILHRNGTGEELREYINVKDAANFCSSIMLNKYFNKHIMVTGNQVVKIKDLLKIINEIFDNKLKIKIIKKRLDDHYENTPYSYMPK
ncbi:NAD(P)-dependent oxidoreductase, partial [Alphaproteobacteria bacterium]|nr:NAD(P)-dependent oxidoreductase [Alphaproteobacteria bacterium]